MRPTTLIPNDKLVNVAEGGPRIWWSILLYTITYVSAPPQRFLLLPQFLMVSALLPQHTLRTRAWGVT